MEIIIFNTKDPHKENVELKGKNKIWTPGSKNPISMKVKSDRTSNKSSKKWSFNSYFDDFIRIKF